MAINRTLSDLPVTITPANSDILHNRQSNTDKSISMDKLSEFVLTDSIYSPLVENITGNHTISTVPRKQIIIATIISDATLVFPISYVDGIEISVRNNITSTANVIGFPDSLVLAPGEEVTYFWNGSAFIRKSDNVLLHNFRVDDVFFVDADGTTTSLILKVTDPVFPRISSTAVDTPLYAGAGNITTGEVFVVAKNDFSNPANHLVSVDESGNAVFNGILNSLVLEVTDPVFPRISSTAVDTPLYAGAGNITTGEVFVVAKNDFSNPANHLVSVDESGNAVFNGILNSLVLEVTDPIFPRISSTAVNTPLYAGAENITTGNVFVIAKNDFSISTNHLISIDISGNISMQNNTAIQMKDNVSVLKTLVKLDSTNQQLFGDISGGSIYLNTSSDIFFKTGGLTQPTVTINSTGLAINTTTTVIDLAIGVSNTGFEWDGTSLITKIAGITYIELTPSLSRISIYKGIILYSTIDLSNTKMTGSGVSGGQVEISGIDVEGVGKTMALLFNVSTATHDFKIFKPILMSLTVGVGNTLLLEFRYTTSTQVIENNITGDKGIMLNPGNYRITRTAGTSNFSANCGGVYGTSDDKLTSHYYQAG